MTSEGVYYYVGTVRTHFTEWLGCATKQCKGHKKNPQVCHIRPETPIFPVGNGLYECLECHNLLSIRYRQGPFWDLRDAQGHERIHVTLLTPQEQAELRHHLDGIREGFAKGLRSRRQPEPEPEPEPEQEEEPQIVQGIL